MSTGVVNSESIQAQREETKKKFWFELDLGWFCVAETVYWEEEGEVSLFWVVVHLI